MNHGLTRKELEKTPEILGRIKDKPTGANLIVCYTEPNKLSVFVSKNSRDEPEFLCDVDGIFMRVDSCINTAKWSMKKDLWDTLDAIKRNR